MSSHSLPWGGFPNPGIELRSPALQTDSLLSGPPGKPPFSRDWEVRMRELSFRGRREGDEVRGCVEMNVHRSGPDIVGKLLSSASGPDGGLSSGLQTVCRSGWGLVLSLDATRPGALSLELGGTMISHQDLAVPFK